MESVRIEEISSKEEESLNLKSEWGRSKLPNIQVTKPKGTTRPQNQREGGNKRMRTMDARKEVVTHQEAAQSSGEGRKRIRLEGLQTSEVSVEVTLVRTKLVVTKGESPSGKDIKVKSFTQLKLKEMPAKNDFWSPGKEGDKVTTYKGRLRKGR